MATWEDSERTSVAPGMLGAAARDNDVGLLAALVGRGADVNARDARGYTALMLAAYEGCGEAFDWLLANGADPNARDNAGNSVLMGVAFKGHAELARKLLAAGADPSVRNHSQMSALQVAAMFGRDDIVQLLEAYATAAREVR